MVSTPSFRLGAASGHTWTFFRAGGLDQVKLLTADDLRNLGQLDQKLWVALSCPVKGVEFDRKTLELIDEDGDGRVRAPEVIAAVNWACARLKDPVELLKPKAALPLSAINDATPEGKAVLASAKQILENLGKPTATEVSVADTSDVVRIFADTVFNGDGVVQAGCAKDEATKKAIEEIINIAGPEADRSGKPGVTKAKLDGFFADLTAYNTWWTAGEEASKPGSGVLPLGDGTPAAFTTLQAVKAKISDFFSRTSLASYDPRAAAKLNRAESEYDAIASKDLSTLGAEIEALPIAQIIAGRGLPLTTGVNPAWSARLAAFRASVVKPILGELTELSEAAWLDLCAKFATYESWLASKQGATVETLGIIRIRELLASTAKADIEALIAHDLEVAPHVAAIQDADRLARYYRDLGTLLQNFVNFGDFYDRKPPPPIFICGTLFLDQRSCELCIKVDSPDAHAGLATLGKCYIAYCKCTRPSGESMFVACVFSQGDDDYLMVGRNGLFYDRVGRDWDATITKVISNPISIRQAFWSPYKKFVRMIEEQVAKRASAADEAANAKLQGAATNVANVDKNAKDAKPEPKKFDVGVVAAMGVALGAIGTLLGGLIAGFIGLGLWMPLGFLGIILAISGPSMLIAWLKLRQRTLGPILEANGWAINGRVRINIPLGTALTAAKKLPPGSRRLLDDPFEDKEAAKRKKQAIATIVLLIILGLAGWLAWDRIAKGRWCWELRSSDHPAGSTTAAALATPPVEPPN